MTTLTNSLESPQEWDLSDLYHGLDDPKIQQDLDRLQQQATTFRQTYRGQIAQLSPEQILNCLQQLETLFQACGYLWAYPSLVFSADTRNSAAKQLLDRVMEAVTTLENDVLFFDLELKQLPESQLNQLQQSPELASYHHYLQQIAKFRPYALSEAVEQTRNQDNLTGRSAFIQLRSLHLGEQNYTPVTTPEGKTAETEADLSALRLHPSPEIRYQSYLSLREVMQEHNLLYGYILNSIAQDHKLENKMRGYDSTLRKQLLEDHVSEPVFQAIMTGMADRYDLFQRYYHLKAKTLGETIRSCDIYAPWTQDPSPSLPYKSGVEILLNALEKFDINYARRAEEFFLKNWVDAKVRPGKRGGAFCAYSHGKHSYLLLSYTEDYNSLFTLAHEMGHGLHFAWIDDHQSYFNSNPPMVMAEVASTFNELLLLDFLLDSSDPALKLSILTGQLEDQLSLLFRQSTISRLELLIHERATEGSFDHHFVNQKWMELYEQLCGDSVTLLPEHQYDWARVGHIFFKPFYCYQYTASHIVSLACYQQYRQVGKEFVPGYLDLLSTGGSVDQVEALKQYVGIDLTDSATIYHALEYVQGLIDQLEETLKASF
ncbi:M3 family metallopeptidase [Roseofilum sp. BLCC_M154]|uniref:M3 family metallopeptidase n=1 Tax=Roseofilum acuticapitatum BLCC-M154 TaxID=3022444 RepID=A0ABT7AYA6_9CYAN|nr:M3 family metallopeptidase [Roseofilum acuticapitatum]MDJ1171887.1 M3 family metallopeptidase [Roseofilum acuticapitatum BLCC-M154]